jgi:competence protein ComEC
VLEVLKVPRHGSQPRPESAVISDGFENSWHHPHPEVLERLAAHRAAILRADQMGLITIRMDGRGFRLETAVSVE